MKDRNRMLPVRIFPNSVFNAGKRTAATAICLALAAMPVHAQVSLSGGQGSNGYGSSPGGAATGMGHLGNQPGTSLPDLPNTPTPETAEAPDHQIAAPVAPPMPKGVVADNIYAVINGEVITRADIDNRAKLFALSAGLPLSADVMARLRGQIGRELIDDRLRLQEIQRRKIVVADTDVAGALGDIEKRNGLKPGGLRDRLASQGVDFSAMISQIRAQLGWTRVLRQHMADRSQITREDVASQQALLKSQNGQPQYRVSEIFVSAEDPAHMGEARKFADTVIEQLRHGAPFGIVAAEFSQSQTALQGGDLGWVRPDQLDPQVGGLINAMPIGAVSNPIEVAGGYSIMTVRERRIVGQDLATVLTLRQAFFGFATPLDPQAPTDQQKTALKAAANLSTTATSCADVEAANAKSGTKRPSDPGDVREDRLNPNMQQVLKTVGDGKATRPLVTPEGVLVVMVCGRAQKNMAAVTPEDIANQLLQERVELSSRQLQQDLKRRALIDVRG